MISTLDYQFQLPPGLNATSLFFFLFVEFCKLFGAKVSILLLSKFFMSGFVKQLYVTYLIDGYEIDQRKTAICHYILKAM